MTLKLRVTRGESKQVRLVVSLSEGNWFALVRPAATVVVAALIVGLLVWSLTPGTPETRIAEIVGPMQSVPPLPQPWPQSLALSAAREVDGSVRAGNTLVAALRGSGLSGDLAHELIGAAKGAIDPRRIRAGQPFHLYFDQGDELLALRYPIDRQRAWFVTRGEDGWRTDEVVLPVRVRPTFLSATISGSLERALANRLRDRRSVHDLAFRIADIYGWDIDFSHDLRHGDRLDLVVEERWIGDEFIGYGEILAAEFRVLGRVVPVVAFRETEDELSYFSPDGQSVRRRFLRSPVRFDRISSRFSLRRVHPVTGIARAHRGVDYVANPGTPIQATADGIVQEARYGREPGRYVRIRHGGSYSTIYMHLSRFAQGVEPGVPVAQGQVIGYVGKTGNATGYHLHYGLIQGERYVDPLELQMPAADPVPSGAMPAFVQQRDRWLGMLRDGQTRLDIQVAGAGGL